MVYLLLQFLQPGDVPTSLINNEMNRITIKIASILCFALLLATVAVGQKFGHINSQQLLLESSEVKAADTQIETFQNQMLEKGKQMVAGFEADYQTYMQEANSKTLSPVQMQAKEAALQEKQQAIQKYEVEMQQKVGMKREELLQPIIEKINTAIEAVGKEGGYTMIFDTASGAVLHALDTEDVIDKVRARL